jgi:hypothetical protein
MRISSSSSPLSLSFSNKAPYLSDDKISLVSLPSFASSTNSFLPFSNSCVLKILSNVADFFSISSVSV